MISILKMLIDIIRGKRNVALYTNTFYITLSGALSSVLSFGFWIAAARFFSDTQVGQAKALLSAAALVTSISCLGLQMGLIRFLPSEENKNEMINTCLSLCAVSCFLGASIFVIGSSFWSRSLVNILHEKVVLVSFFILVITTGLISMQYGIFLVFHRVQFSALQQSLSAALKIPLVVFLAFWGTKGLFNSWVISFFVAFMVSLILFSRVEPSYRLRPTFNKNIIKKIAFFSIGNYFADITGGLSSNVLPLIIINILGAKPNAYFSIAYALAGALFLVINSVATALFVEGSHEPEKIHNNLVRALKVVLLLLPLIAIFIFLGDKILLIFGKTYSQNSFEVLRLLSLAAIPMSINEIYIQIKRIQLSIRYMIYLYLAITIITIGLGYFLMLRMGLIGVGIGWLAGQTIPMFFTGRVVLNYMRRKPVS